MDQDAATVQRPMPHWSGIHHLHGKVEKKAANAKSGWNADLIPNWRLWAWKSFPSLF
jgi:hypothetical protein